MLPASSRFLTRTCPSLEFPEDIAREREGLTRGNFLLSLPGASHHTPEAPGQVAAWLASGPRGLFMHTHDMEDPPFYSD